MALRGQGLFFKFPDYLTLKAEQPEAVNTEQLEDVDEDYLTVPTKDSTIAQKIHINRHDSKKNRCGSSNPRSKLSVFYRSTGK